MDVLHTESSRGWGGQEIRILREAEGLRSRGHRIYFVVNTQGKLAARARDAGFVVYELPFCKLYAAKTVIGLLHIIRKHGIELVNTHSSMDAWLGGVAAKIAGKKILRTRHLSTSIKPGLNSHLLYNKLADFVITTSAGILPMIASQAKLSKERMRCVPTGVDVERVVASAEESHRFRQSLGLNNGDILVGTVCFVRSWKGIMDFLKAAALLKHRQEIKWVVVGGGHVEDYRHQVPAMGLEGRVFFTGHLESPYAAIQAMDMFLLLSTAHEGISQASLQAAYLKRPLITTSVGGLPEVCLDRKTGLVVPPFSPEHVAEAVTYLVDRPELREEWGKAAHDLVMEKFHFTQTLDVMEEVYSRLKTE